MGTCIINRTYLKIDFEAKGRGNRGRQGRKGKPPGGAAALHLGARVTGWLFLKHLVRFEMILVVILLFGAALLSQETPARRALHKEQVGAGVISSGCAFFNHLHPGPDGLTRDAI